MPGCQKFTHNFRCKVLSNFIRVSDICHAISRHLENILDPISGNSLELRTDVLDVTIVSFGNFILIVRSRNLSAAIINIHFFFQKTVHRQILRNEIN